MAPGSLQGEWRRSWPTMRWHHHAAVVWQRGTSALPCSVGAQTWTRSPKPVVGLERLSCLGEERWVSVRNVIVGSQSWSRSIPHPVDTTSRVGHQLSYQLSLLITGLKDRGDRLSQTWRWRRIPVPLGVLGPISHVMSVHHSAIQICYH
jgi:hypothetical protein